MAVIFCAKPLLAHAAQKNPRTKRFLRIMSSQKEREKHSLHTSSVVVTIMPKKKEITWKDSEAKRLLIKDLTSGNIPLDPKEMEPAQVYLQRPEFASFAYEHFRDRLRDLRAQIRASKHCASSDSAALAHDRRIYPKKTHNHRGEPRWEGSEAERLLKQDMDEGKNKTLKPIDLHQSRKEYKLYPLTVFRKHIDQEERRRKYIAYCRARAAKKKS